MATLDHKYSLNEFVEFRSDDGTAFGFIAKVIFRKTDMVNHVVEYGITLVNCIDTGELTVVREDDIRAVYYKSTTKE